jgi:hypothetical protein
MSHYVTQINITELLASAQVQWLSLSWHTTELYFHLRTEIGIVSETLSCVQNTTRGTKRRALQQLLRVMLPRPEPFRTDLCYLRLVLPVWNMSEGKSYQEYATPRRKMPRLSVQREDLRYGDFGSNRKASIQTLHLLPNDDVTVCLIPEDDTLSKIF